MTLSANRLTESPHTVEEREQLGIVITGGSRGLGYALAREFLLRGDRVVICGRDSGRVEQAVATLRSEVGGSEVYGTGFDVRDSAALGRFRSFVVTRLGRVDRWINNAGTAGAGKGPLWEIEPDDMMETISTNLYGSMLMCRMAVDIMGRQSFEDRPRYHIFNMGFSPFGARFSRSGIPHKASKLGVAALSRFLAAELDERGFRGIGVHELSPGLVKTDLLMRGTSGETAAFLDLVAEEPGKVARVLAGKIGKAHGKGSRIRYRPLPVMGARIVFKLVGRRTGDLLVNLRESAGRLRKGKGGEVRKDGGH